MMRRVDRAAPAFKRFAAPRERKPLLPLGEAPEMPLALVYSNGYVTVEISHDALDAYIEMTGDVPLPIVRDSLTGDRRLYDARHKVSVVYDHACRIREIATRNRDGLFVRLNFTDDEG